VSSSGVAASPASPIASGTGVSRGGRQIGWAVRKSISVGVSTGVKGDAHIHTPQAPQTLGIGASAQEGEVCGMITIISDHGSTCGARASSVASPAIWTMFPWLSANSEVVQLPGERGSDSASTMAAIARSVRADDVAHSADSEHEYGVRSERTGMDMRGSGAEAHRMSTAITMGVGSGQGGGEHEGCLPDHADTANSVVSGVRDGMVSDDVPCGERHERHSQPRAEGSGCTREVEMGAILPECTSDMSMVQTVVGSGAAGGGSHMQREQESEAIPTPQSPGSAVGHSTEAKQVEGAGGRWAAPSSRDKGVSRRRRRGARGRRSRCTYSSARGRTRRLGRSSNLGAEQPLRRAEELAREAHRATTLIGAAASGGAVRAAASDDDGSLHSPPHVLGPGADGGSDGGRDVAAAVRGCSGVGGKREAPAARASRGHGVARGRVQRAGLMVT